MKPAKELVQELLKIEKVEECLEIASNKQLYIKDVSGTAIIADTCIDSVYCFSIINTQQNDIHFIPVDGDGIIGEDCCEAVIFNDVYFSFVELKLNATSNKRRTIYNNRIKAVRQIETALQFFNDKLNNNYQGLLREAIIATPDFYPRADASWIDIATEFADDNDNIPLIEATKKEY